MHLKTIQAGAFRTVFEVLKDILNDVNIRFDPTGVHLTTLDTSHVTFIDMHLLHDNFEQYSCPNKTLVGLNMLNTFKILKTISGNDILTLSIPESGNTLDMKIENVQKKTSSSFSMKLLDINDDEYDQPAITMDCYTVIQSVVFQRIIRDMSNLAENVVIHRYKDKLVFKCDGDYVKQETEIDCPHTDVDISGVFSLKYINMFIKATGICSNLEIAHSQNGPIAFKYSIANLGEITFFLASLTDT